MPKKSNNPNNNHAVDHRGHRQRVKKRFLKDLSFDNFEEHNIMEMMLFYKQPRGDTNEMAHRIIDHFGSLSAVFDASYDDLIKCKDITPHFACLVKMILPLANAYNRSKHDDTKKLDTFTKISDYLLDRYFAFQDETLSILSMDNCSRIISFDIVSRGSIDSVGLNTRAMLSILLKTGATSAIIAHNHPGGIARPSNGDIAATRTLMRAFANIGVELIDHYIIAGEECVSLARLDGYESLFCERMK